MARGPERREDERPGRSLPPTRAIAVGLTGGLAAGKSTALALFRELGARTIAADEVVTMLYRRPDVQEQLRAEFGQGVVSPDGQVDRAALGGIVAADRGALARLEALVHPLVGDELRAFLGEAASAEVVVCEVPLLFQSGLEGLFDLVVTIEAEPEVRRRRRQARGGTDIMDDLDRLQLTTEERVRRSDLAFVNEGGLDELRAFVAAAFEVAQARGAGRAVTGGPRAVAARAVRAGEHPA